MGDNNERARIGKMLKEAGLNPNDPQLWNSLLGNKPSTKKPYKYVDDIVEDSFVEEKVAPTPIITPAEDALARDEWGNFKRDSESYKRIKEAGFPYGGDRDPDHWDEYCYYEM